MEQAKVFIISGPSGSGKTTLHDKLLEEAGLSDRLIKTVSWTTRKPRPGEKEGHDYHFVDRGVFQKGIDEGRFLEWEEVFGNFYGTPRESVDTILKENKNALLCIDVKGARTVRRHFPEAVTIFVKAPSLKELKSRLKLRGTEAEEVLRKRLQTASEELTEEGSYRYSLVNNNLEETYRELADIIKREIRE